MTGTSRDEFLRRLDDQIMADIDCRKEGVATAGFQMRIQIKFLQPGATAKPDEMDFFGLNSVCYTRKGLTINPGELGVAVNRRVPEKDLPP